MARQRGDQGLDELLVVVVFAAHHVVHDDLERPGAQQIGQRAEDAHQQSQRDPPPVWQDQGTEEAPRFHRSPLAASTIMVGVLRSRDNAVARWATMRAFSLHVWRSAST